MNFLNKFIRSKEKCCENKENYKKSIDNHTCFCGRNLNYNHKCTTNYCFIHTCNIPNCCSKTVDPFHLDTKNDIEPTREELYCSKHVFNSGCS